MLDENHPLHPDDLPLDVAHPDDAAVDSSPATGDTLPDAQGRLGAILRELLETALLAALIWGGINLFIPPYMVLGPSMEPTLVEGERLLVARLQYWVSEPQRGDIIVFHPPTDPTGTPLVKRVIGLPGDEVAIRGYQVYINGELLDEPYLPEGTLTLEDSTWAVPAGYYFVMGDNRLESSDSRRWGLLPRDLIIGKAWVIYWPPTEWGSVVHASQP
ncbi:MAG: signal peptidase I [Anaerolineae bacterium]